MKVFISWSGSISRDVAEALREWLPLVIQAVEPYVSSEDIDPGARWSEDIAVQLDDTNFGILCVTRDNVTTPWLNFEAGALSKSVDRSRVVPFLVGLGPSDIPRGPLVQFQAVEPTQTGVLRLVRAMNDWCGALPPERLEEVVNVWWPHLEQKLQIIQQSNELAEAATLQRTTPDMLAELLELTRGLQRELRIKDVSPPLVESHTQLEATEGFLGFVQIRGFQVTDLSATHGPADLKLEREGRAIYVAFHSGREPISKGKLLLDQIHRHSIHDPVLLVLLRPFKPSFLAEVKDQLGPNIHVVRWFGTRDSDELAMVLNQLTQA